MAADTALPVSATSLVEADIIDKLRTAFGSRIRICESLPGEWDDDALKRILVKTPGIYVAFTGGAASAPGSTCPQLNGQWMVYVATGHAQGNEARRLGDAQQVGAYTMWEVVALALHGRVIAKLGTATFQRVENLFTGTVDNRGVAVYAVAFDIPFTLESDAASLLSPFATLDAKYDIPGHTPADYDEWLAGDTTRTKPDAEDVVVIPT